MIETDKLAAERIIAATPVSPNEEAFELLKELGMPFRGVKKD